MANHVNGTIQFMEALLGGRYATRGQVRDMVDFLFAGMKRNIENSPYAIQAEKDAEIHRREYWQNLIKASMGL